MVFYALGIQVPHIDAVITPGRSLLSHAETNQRQGEAGLLELFAWPGLKQILGREGRRKTQSASSEDLQLLFEGKRLSASPFKDSKHEVNAIASLHTLVCVLVADCQLTGN
jgi:hypothetical protein